MSREEGGRGLTSIQDSVDTSIRRLEDHIKEQKNPTNHSDVEQHKQHNVQQINDKETKRKKKRIDISNDKQARYRARILGHGFKNKTLRKKLNIF